MSFYQGRIAIGANDPGTVCSAYALVNLEQKVIHRRTLPAVNEGDIFWGRWIQ